MLVRVIVALAALAIVLVVIAEPEPLMRLTKTEARYLAGFVALCIVVVRSLYMYVSFLLRKASGPVEPPEAWLTAASQPNTESLNGSIRALLSQGKKIEAIELYRQHTGIGLAQAREAVEMIESAEPVQPAGVNFISLHVMPTRDLLKQRRSVLLLGALLLAIGVIAASVAPFLTPASPVFIGRLLIIAAVVQGLQIFAFLRQSGYRGNLFLPLPYSLLGILIVADAGDSTQGLTQMTGLFLILGGAIRIEVAAMIRFHNSLWKRLHGAIDLLLGILIWQQWPLAGPWVVGLYMGIDLIFNGWSLVMLGLTAKKRHSE